MVEGLGGGLTPSLYYTGVPFQVQIISDFALFRARIDVEAPLVCGVASDTSPPLACA